MNEKELKEICLKEESTAHINGWDFSHIEGRCKEESLPWDYRQTILEYLKPEHRLLDIDTGGGEFLLSLSHPHSQTSATEGFPPNIELCKKMLRPLGIDFRAADAEKELPFPDEYFDIVINRHGSFNVREILRVLKKDGLFITQQVGEENDRALVKLLLPNAEKPYPGWNLQNVIKSLEDCGFETIKSKEAFPPIRFFDVRALVWFARIIKWEFPSFSVENCFDRLIEVQKHLLEKGFIESRTHRFLIVAKKI